MQSTNTHTLSPSLSLASFLPVSPFLSFPSFFLVQGCHVSLIGLIWTLSIETVCRHMQKVKKIHKEKEIWIKESSLLRAANYPMNGRSSPFHKAATAQWPRLPRRRGKRRVAGSARAPDVLELDTLCISLWWVCLMDCTREKQLSTELPATPNLSSQTIPSSDFSLTWGTTVTFSVNDFKVKKQSQNSNDKRCKR